MILYSIETQKIHIVNSTTDRAHEHVKQKPDIKGPGCIFSCTLFLLFWTAENCGQLYTEMIGQLGIDGAGMLTVLFHDLEFITWMCSLHQNALLYNYDLCIYDLSMYVSLQ